MSLSAAVHAALADLDLVDAHEIAVLGGGSINHVRLLQTDSGRRVVLKENASAPRDLFASEADGLRLLRSARDGPPAPEPLAWSPTFLLLDYLEPMPTAPAGWEVFGRALAQLHNHTGPDFGAVPDNYLGDAPQLNGSMVDGHAFFAERRLEPQLARAYRRALLTDRDLAAGRRVMQRLAELIPTQPASLLHGDLWSGNVIAGPGGALAVIDPAAHFGWAEADLAMTALFGGFPERFYSAYVETRTLAPGWRERFTIYNLYHLLNHLNLFGEGYLGGVRAVLQRFGA